MWFAPSIKTPESLLSSRFLSAAAKRKSDMNNPFRVQALQAQQAPVAPSRSAPVLTKRESEVARDSMLDTRVSILFGLFDKNGDGFGAFTGLQPAPLASTVL